MAERMLGMETRLAVAVAAQIDPDRSVTRLCAELGVSRDTYYRLRARFAAGGIEGLLPRSRRPRRSPTRTDEAMVDAIVAARRRLIEDGTDCGARSIGYQLRREGLRPPSVRTIHRVLVRAGLVSPQPRKRPRSAYRRFVAARPNQMWQLDGTDWRLADGTGVVILRLQDDHSRMIMASRAAPSENSVDAWECMLTAMRRHGAPAAVLSDGGSAFTARRIRGGLGDFEALLRAHGITPIVASPHHPQTCGKKEREWSTQQRWLAVRPAAADLAGLQRQLDSYDTFFNTVRNHQGIDGDIPARRWAATPAASPAADPLPAPMASTNVKVTANGVVHLGNRYRTSIGVGWAHARVDVVRDGLDVAIIHRDQIIRTLRISPDLRYQTRPSTTTPRRNQPALPSDMS
ncbi:MAG: DDE-type integrase/transposase/recombinase [Pseudonocardiales bacterium]|nr:DDE-type integrase/transposase/recombinase [Pseudonocardiales bacterium]